MLFNKKTDKEETKTLKQEIFEETIHGNKMLKVMCFIEAVAIVGLFIALMVKGG